MAASVELERARRRRDTALGYRIFGALRWGDTGDGHISARDPEQTDHFWVLARDVSFDRATVADLVLVGPDGAVAGSAGVYNTTAYNIHGPIHDARADVAAAAHTHTPWGTPFAAERRLLDPVSQEACAFFEDHSVFDDEEVQVASPAGGRRIAEALGDRRAVILANHGLLTVGASVAEAIGAFVMLERVAEVHLKAPGAKPISAAGARQAKGDLDLPAGFSRSFDYLVMRYVGDPAVVE